MQQSRMRSLFGTATGLFPLRYVNDVGACIAEEIILIGLVRAKQQQAVGASEKFGHGVTVPGCALPVEVGSGFVEEYDADVGEEGEAQFNPLLHT